MRMKEKFLRLNLYLGLSVLFFSTLFSFLGVPLIKTWFFSLAWWSLILSVDSLNFRRLKSSPLSGPFRYFLFTAFASVFVWLIFELFNLRLNNWVYKNLPPSVFQRWLGYFIAFATVVPAMKEISLFFQSLLGERSLALFRFQARSLFLKACLFFGALSVFLTLTWPRLFFPLTWLCFIFILDPLNLSLGNQTLLKDLERKNWTRLWSWVLTGLVAGFLWEFWNSLAESHWEYSLPYLDSWRIFKMPVFGYTGFLPFALEVFAFDQLLSGIHEKLKRKISLKAVIFIALLLFYGVCFYLIDRWTLIR